MSEFLTTGRGDRVAYDRYGSGPALIFVAGAGPYRAIDPITTPTAQIAATQGISTIVYDRLGRGESPADGVLDLDRELDALAALIAVAGGPAVLCGHSSGCAISLCAALAGLPVDGLILWEAPLSRPAAETQAWTSETERLMDAGQFEDAQRHYMRDMPPEGLARIESLPHWPQIAAGVVSLRADGQALSRATAALESGELAGLEVPVLAAYGTRTFPEMPLAAQRLAESLPAVIVRELPGADHAWDPEPMAAEIAAFVTSLPRTH